MKNNDVEKVSGGVGFLGLLALIFITLKLTGVIDWSWWWILSPLWFPPTFVIAVIVVCLIITAIMSIGGKKDD